LTGKIEPNCWAAAVEVKEKWYKSVIMVVSHSPSASDADFMNFLVNIVEDLIVKKECIVVGDFNIDIMVSSFYSRKLQTIMNSMGMKQYINKPTRITKQSSSIIDLVFSNKEIEVNVMYEPMVTDHACLRIEQRGSSLENKYREYTARDYSEFNAERFVETLKNGLEHNRNRNVSERAGNLVGNMIQALNTVAPKKQFKIPRRWKGKRWFNDEIKKAAIRRDEIYKKAIYENTELNWSHYKRERNTVVKLIRDMKKKYYENMIDHNKRNPAAMWKTLKEIIRGEPSGSLKAEDINFESLVNTEKRSIADNFNLFYIESINAIVSSIGGIPEDSEEVINADNGGGEVLRQFDTVSIEEVEKIVLRLTRKKGTEEGISTDIMKTAWQVIKSEYVDIINSSLNEGICPEGWKTSTIKPIPKIEQPKKASHFRPINVLPTFEKVLELVVKEQLVKYIDSNNIITEHQSGFRNGYSCETAIQVIIDEWKLLVSDKKMIGVIFMDLRRAFETIDRERLLRKLYQYGIRDRVLQWIRSYLTGRLQQVNFDNKRSGLLNTEYGVPQGSVLGPLLFIIYINDIIKACSGRGKCSIKMFADDTLIYVSGEGTEELQNRMSRAFLRVEQWMKVNKLKMNAEKTKFMIVRGIRKEQRGEIGLRCADGTQIERVEAMKYLGIIIDDRLRFADHCDYVLKKIGKKISFLNRIGNSITVYARCMIYKSIIAPHFEYCATLIIDMGETQLGMLQKAQNRAMRVILHCDKYTKIERMLQALQFMSIKQRLYYNVCVFIYKILNNMLPVLLRNKFAIIGNENQRLTRQTGNIVLDLRRTRSAQKSVFHEGVKMYNSLPADIKQKDRLETFKHDLKEYILSRITYI